MALAISHLPSCLVGRLAQVCAHHLSGRIIRLRVLWQVRRFVGLIYTQQQLTPRDGVAGEWVSVHVAPPGGARPPVPGGAATAGVLLLGGVHPPRAQRADAEAAHPRGALVLAQPARQHVARDAAHHFCAADAHAGGLHLQHPPGSRGGFLGERSVINTE